MNFISDTIVFVTLFENKQIFVLKCVVLEWNILNFFFEQEEHSHLCIGFKIPPSTFYAHIAFKNFCLCKCKESFFCCCLLNGDSWNEISHTMILICMHNSCTPLNFQTNLLLYVQYRVKTIYSNKVEESKL